jgi:hypothetical protein
MSIAQREMWNAWNETKKHLPPRNIEVETKIDDGKEVRNVQRLTFKDNLWWTKDGTYVYYVPTHWKF